MPTSRGCVRDRPGGGEDPVHRSGDGTRDVLLTKHDYDSGQPDSSRIRLYYDPVDGKGGGRVVKLTQRKYSPRRSSRASSRPPDSGSWARYGDFFWTPLDGGAESQVLGHATGRSRPQTSSNQITHSGALIISDDEFLFPTRI